MSFEVLAHTIKKALYNGRSAQFIWHGGEPLLASEAFLKKAVLLQHKFSKNQYISNSIQTNGTLLNESWLDFFDQHGFMIGLSLDGPEELHNKNRILSNGKDTFENVMKSISLIKKRYNSVNLIAVITEDTLRLGAKKFFSFFIENGLNHFSLLSQKPVIILGREDYIKMNTYSQFMNELFDLYLELDDPSVHILQFDSILNSMIGNGKEGCILAGGCIGKYFAINYNGDIYHCDEFMTDSNYKLGNIINNDFEEILQSDQISMLRDQNQREIDELSCKWFSVCKGGCPKDRYVPKMFSRDKVVCCGYSDLIEHISERISTHSEIVNSKIKKRQISLSQAVK